MLPLLPLICDLLWVIFFALGPLTSPNLNIAAIWVTDPWVSIQINFWGSVPPTGEVPHTCKIVYYF